MRRVRMADAAVVSIGKSGRTWLRAMVSHIYHRRYGLPAGELINFDNFHAWHPMIPRILFTGVASEDRAPSGRTWGEEVATVERVVLLTRDPRDVAVSFYFQMTERATERELQRKGLASRKELREMNLIDFLVDPLLGVPRVTRFLRGWQAVIDRHPRALSVSYEELRADTCSAFGRAARFLDPASSEAEIADAVGFGAFETMQAREREGFFASERLRTRGETADGLKVRRGKIGGYRDYLSAEEVATVDRLVASVPTGALQPRS